MKRHRADNPFSSKEGYTVRELTDFEGGQHHNLALRQYYGVDEAAVLASAEQQHELFYKIFPDQVDAGLRKPETLDWMLNRTCDGTTRNAPRELIQTAFREP